MTIDANLLLFGTKDIELYEKYNVFFYNGKRIYKIDLNERRLDLTSATPFQLNIIVNGQLCMLKESSWSSLLLELFNLLQFAKPLPLAFLKCLEFDWSSTKPFVEERTRRSDKKTKCGLYMFCGYVATHSFWVIRELLYEYGINEGVLFVFRQPLSEPIEIVTQLVDKRKELFKQYILYFYDDNQDKANKIIQAIDVFNVLMARRGYGYNNLYLIEDSNTIGNYMRQLLIDMEKYTDWSLKKIEVAREYLELFRRYRRYEKVFYLNNGQSIRPFSKVQKMTQRLALEHVEKKKNSVIKAKNIEVNTAKKQADKEIIERYKNVSKTVLLILSNTKEQLTSEDIASFICAGTGDKSIYLTKEFPNCRAGYRNIFSKSVVKSVIDALINEKHIECDYNGFLKIHNN